MGTTRWLAVALMGTTMAWPFHRAPGHRSRPSPKPSVVQGARLYQRACLSCHGPRGDGQALALLPDGTTAPPLDGLVGEGRSQRRLESVIAQGSGMMPGWASVMTPVQLKSLVLYVQSLNPSSPASPSPQTPRSSP